MLSFPFLWHRCILTSLWLNTRRLIYLCFMFVEEYFPSFSFLFYHSSLYLPEHNANKNIRAKNMGNIRCISLWILCRNHAYIVYVLYESGKKYTLLVTFWIFYNHFLYASFLLLILMLFFFIKVPSKTPNTTEYSQN